MSDPRILRSRRDYFVDKMKFMRCAMVWIYGYCALSPRVSTLNNAKLRAYVLVMWQLNGICMMIQSNHNTFTWPSSLFTATIYVIVSSQIKYNEQWTHFYDLRSLKSE